MADDEEIPDESVLVFVPSYNDMGTVEAVIAEVRCNLPGAGILVIDDGSAESADFDPRPLGVRLFRLPANFGLGTCTHIAFDYALARGYQTLVRIDSDGQHPTADIPKLLAPLAGATADLVVGSRRNRNDREGSDGWLRSLVSNYFSKVATLISHGRTPKDVNSGFFAINRAVMEALNKHALERYPEPQMFVLAARAGWRIAEVYVSQRQRDVGVSTLDLFGAARFLYRFNMFVLGELLKGRR